MTDNRPKEPESVQLAIDQLISELTISIGHKSTAVFCGAGISFNSGMPLASQVISGVLDQLEMSEDDRQLILSYNLPFETFIQVLKKSSDMDPFFNIFGMGEPNTNHILLAKLIKAGQLTDVVTTNFDQLIERAMENEGLVAGKDYEVVYQESDLERIDFNNGKPRLIKIHGSFEDKEGMAITIEQVAGAIYSEPRRNIIEHIFSKGPHRNVLVIGYSLSDAFDVSPYISAIEADQKRVIHLEHASDERVEDITVGKGNNPFSKFKGGHRVFFDTDRLVKYLWENLEDLIGEKYSFFCENELPWRKHLETWFSKAEKEHTKAFRYAMAGNLFLQILDPLKAEGYLEQALAIVQRTGNRYEELCALTDMGIVHAQLQQYSFSLPQEVIAFHESALAIARELKSPLWEARNLANLGTIYLNHSEIVERLDIEPFESSVRKAIDYYKSALTILERAKDKKMEGGLFGSLGRAYGRLGQFSEQVQYYNKAITILRDIGDVSGQAGNLANMGMTYIEFGKLGKAVPCLKQAVELFGRMRLKEAEDFCRSLLKELGSRLGSYETSQVEYEEALEAAEQQLIVTVRMGDEQKVAKQHVVMAYALRIFGQYREAIEHFDVALALLERFGGSIHSLAERLQKHRDQARLIMNTQDPAWRPDLIGIFEQSDRQIVMARATGNREIEAGILISKGLIYSQFYFYPKAVGYFKQTLQIAEENQNNPLKIEAMGNLAASYYNLGLYPKAVESYQEMLGVLRVILQRNSQEMIQLAEKNLEETREALRVYTNAIGATPNDFGLAQKAIEYYTQAEQYMRGRMNTGFRYLESSDYTKAIMYFEQALDVAQRIGDKGSEKDILNKTARAYYSVGRPTEAIGFLEQMLNISRAIGDRLGEADALGNLGYIHSGLGACQKAIGYHEQASTIYESLLGRSHPFTKREMESLEAAKKKSSTG